MSHSPNNTLPSILAKIIATKQHEVAKAKANYSLDAIKAQALEVLATNNAPQRGFATALRQQQNSQSIGMIAEIKKASPSKGIIAQNFDPSAIAKQYEAAGATCLSVLTDTQYFMGDNQYLKEAKSACSLPVLRKDFMIDAYQIYESYLLGADCVLLIVACLDKDTLHNLHKIACQLGMDVLIEVHTQEEMTLALTLPDSQHNIYGINNRDLNTFSTNLSTSIDLKSFLESHYTATDVTHLLVTESGIHTSDDVKLMLKQGIHCFLIGEQFMKTDQPGQTLRLLLQSI